MVARRVPRCVDGLPGDEDGHDGGLAGAGSEFQREPHQLRVGDSVGRREMVKQALAVLGLGCDLSQSDRGSHCPHLAEERTDTAEPVIAPVLKNAGRLRSDLPLIGIGQGTPCVHMTVDFIDDRLVVLLLFGRKPLAFVEQRSRLCGGFTFLRLWDRRDEFGAASGSMIFCVGCPVSSSSQYLIGYS